MTRLQQEVTFHDAVADKTIGPPPNPIAANLQTEGQTSERKMRMRTWAVICIACLLLLLGSVLGTVKSAAQQETRLASIAGHVEDSSGAAIVGATVTVNQLDTGDQTTITTNGLGNYVFPSLSTAHYKLRVMARGFQNFQESDLILQANQSLSAGVKLKVDAATETIQVNTATPDSSVTPNSSSATRTDTPLIEVPQAVKTITRTLLIEEDVHTLAGALVNVAGVVPTKAEEIGIGVCLQRGPRYDESRGCGRVVELEPDENRDRQSAEATGSRPPW